MKNLQESVLFKTLCVLLSCLFFAAGITVAAAGFIEAENTDYINSPYYRSIYGSDRLASTFFSAEYVGHATAQYQYDQMVAAGKKPDSSQKYQYEQAMAKLRSENTNFRYRILDLKGKTLYSNLSGSEDITKLCSNRYFSGITQQEKIYLGGFLCAVSANDLTCEDYLNQQFILDGGLYYDAESYNEYMDQMENYNRYKKGLEAAVPAPEPDVSSTFVRTMQKRMEISGFFDDEDQFWYYNDDFGTFFCAEYQWAGDEEEQLVYRDKDGDMVMADSYMDADGYLHYHLPGNNGYSSSSEHYDVNWEMDWRNIDYHGSYEEEEPEVELNEPEDFRTSLAAVLEWGIQDSAMNENGIDDEFHQTYWKFTSFEHNLPWYIGIVAACAALCLLFLGLLLCAVGHKKGVEGVYLSPVHKLPSDVLFCLCVTASCCVVGVGVVIANQYYDYYIAPFLKDIPVSLSVWGQIAALPVVLTELIFLTAFLAELVALPFFTTLSAQLKNRCFLRHLLLSFCFRLMKKFFRWMCSLAAVVIRGIRAYWVIPVGYLAFHLVVGILTLQGEHDAICLILAFLLIFVGFAALCWWLYGWKRATEAAKRLAEGDLLHQTGTEYVSWDIKNHIENLNAISAGMNKAVEERLKSDRFRTELITNVSHDLKTPLTSIISYVDLLKKRDIQDETARGYIAVLDQKSQRLKTLTEDLVEASKAATGVLNVNCEQLDAGQLVRQAVGEYEERLAKAQLTVVTQLPEAPVYVNADGRHLWRILDNLLNNCAKYAMPHTRVYATVEEKNGFAFISVKNISAEPLNIPAEELMERFVRGDSSRTNEGSGLGLSIAQSLAVLQGAEFSVSTDGDLFKAELKMKTNGDSYKVGC